MSKMSVVIIDKDPDCIQSIRKHITALNGNASIEGIAQTYEAGFELIHKKRPAVVILESCDDLNESLRRISDILSRFPQVSIFATSKDTSPERILKTMRAGATEYMLKPVADTDIISALQKLGRWIVKPEAERSTARVFTFFAPKGGMGVTTLAINLATNIHQLTEKPTLLIDLDLAAGDVSTFLNLKPNYTITDATVNITRLDKSFLSGVITRHESGVYVLAEPQKVEEGVTISGANLKKMLDLLKTMYSYIVIDTQTAYDERTKAAVDASELVFLTFVMNLPVLKNMQRYLSYFQGMNYSKDKLKIIVNRYLKKGDIKIDDAEKVLKYPIFQSMPNDYETAISCLNRGVPLNSGAPRSALNMAIKDLTQRIISNKV